MSENTTTILWLREDLRLADHSALHAAAKRGRVVPLYIFEQNKDDRFPLGGASRWWLHQALKDLSEQFQALGVPLILRRGDAAIILKDLCKECGAQYVAMSRRYQPYQRKSDETLASALKSNGITAERFPGYLLFEPETIQTGGGTPFKVFTPFSKACFAAPAPRVPLATPQKLETVTGIQSDSLADWKLIPPKAKWPQELAKAWNVSEAAANEQMQQFLQNTLRNYKDGRNSPAKDFTSRLSPYLHFGMISPRQVWHATQSVLARYPELSSTGEKFLLEVLWREFSWHLLHHFPHIPSEPLNSSFNKFPWKNDDAGLAAWQKGLTGYPIVDAGMRQLWQTGWMHNRVRMIAASFLIKDLLIDWRAGAAWFWDTLVDADLGSNSASWQWVAGCGADAAPYFRIFNPTLQGLKFDPQGDYVRRFVPELAALPDEYIHEPWKTPHSLLAQAGVELGKTYPMPIIDHAKARTRALEALKQTKGKDSQTSEIKDFFE